MTKKFVKKVKFYGVVDTGKYRYIYDYNNGCIMRLPIIWLDTTHAIDKWETVARV